MPGSATLAFSEPEDFETALHAEGCLGLWVTGRGRFRARLTRVALERLRLSTAEEDLSRIAFIAVPSDIVLMSFPIGTGAGLVYGGIGMRAGEIMTLGPGQHVHARTDGPCRWGAIWLPVKELVQYGSALTGVPFVVPPFMQCWRPPQAAGKDLHRLHATATRMSRPARAGCADYWHRSGLGRPYFSEHFSPSGVMQRRLLLTSEAIMNGLIYLIGLIVVVLFILSFLGLR